MRAFSALFRWFDTSCYHCRAALCALGCVDTQEKTIAHKTQPRRVTFCLKGVGRFQSWLCCQEQERRYRVAHGCRLGWNVCVAGVGWSYQPPGPSTRAGQGGGHPRKHRGRRWLASANGDAASQWPPIGQSAAAITSQNSVHYPPSPQRSPTHSSSFSPSPISPISSPLKCRIAASSQKREGREDLREERRGLEGGGTTHTRSHFPGFCQPRYIHSETQTHTHTNTHGLRPVAASSRR